MKVRRAEEGDMRRVWEWVNDPTTRAMSITTERIPWEDHVRWYRQLLDDATRALVIGEVDETPIGAVRFDFAGDCAEISIMIAPEARGRQLARPLLDAALDRERPPRAVAHVRPGNKASLRLFSHWMEEGQTTVRGVPVVRFTWSQDAQQMPTRPAAVPGGEHLW